MWRGDIERSPVLAAPSFSNCIRLTTTSLIRQEEEEVQADEPNDLCTRYERLALKIAGEYISTSMIWSPRLFLGLVRASKKFDPTRGAFGPYAKHWIRGELTRLFKPTADAFASEELASIDEPFLKEERADTFSLHDVIPDERLPVVHADIIGLTESEQKVLVGRDAGETLRELGEEFGVSKERVRQIHAKASLKAVEAPGNVARACIRDLTKRRGYQKPFRKPLPFKAQTHPGRSYSREEIDALVASRADLGVSR
jgi:RNA polymerase sigma factor (sigma-70 family)